MRKIRIYDNATAKQRRFDCENRCWDVLWSGLQRPCGRLLRKSSPTSARMCVMAAQTHEQSTCGFYETARPERQEETMATPCSSVFNAGYLCVFVVGFFCLFILLSETPSTLNTRKQTCCNQWYPFDFFFLSFFLSFSDSIQLSHYYRLSDNQWFLLFFFYFFFLTFLVAIFRLDTTTSLVPAQ